MKSLRWLSILLLLTIPAVSARAYNISGEVIGGEGFPLRWVYAVPSTLDTFYIMVANPFTYQYTLSGLAEGGYLLLAYQDLNTNLLPDLDEPRGWYGNSGLPQPLQLSSDTSGINITLNPPNTGGFTGTITYAGADSGGTFVEAFHTPVFDQVPAGVGFLLTNTGNGDYSAFVDSFGTYYARAFMDLNNNFAPDAGEPQAVYGGATPQPFVVEQTNFPDNINFTLIVADADQPSPPELPDALEVGDVYPNPFNNNATLSFTLAAPATMFVTVHDLLGREVTRLADGPFSAGVHYLAIDGQGLASGIYWIELRSGSTVLARRMMLLK
jgi:hypothetical protein